MKKRVFTFMLLAVGALAACSEKQSQETEQNPGTAGAASEIVLEISGGERGTAGSMSSETDSGEEKETVSAEAVTRESEAMPLADGSIADQTFEVELSEYDGKVFFVPFAPTEERPDFHMEIIQNGNVLTTIPGYVPESLAGEPFGSLDAVSFYDVNYDGFTDLVLIETYGDTSFAAVYYGFDREAGEDYDRCFSHQLRLSEAITREASVLSVPGIRDLLSGGKKNGQFADYKEAYQAVAALCRLEGDDEITYDLIYFDEDPTPELTAVLEGYNASLYTYENGSVYMLMDKWAYGAMGNAGYEYAPGKNNMRNYNTDYAGAILHITYFAETDRHAMEAVARIDIYNFDDVNQNGVPDEEETDSMGLYGKSYLNGVEATDEECSGYGAGEYELIGGSLSFEELMAKL